MRTRFPIVAALALAPSCGWAAALFDQGPVELRAFRNPAMAAQAAHPVATENLFGFVLGSDIDAPGTLGVALETQMGFGRREGRYAAGNAKLEVSWAARRDLSLSLSLLGGAWDIGSNPALPDASAMRFRGVGGEIRWRILDRAAAPVGLTLHLEPSVFLADEASGAAGTGYGSENKLILDTELVPDRLWGAINLTYDVEHFRSWNGGAPEEASVLGVGGALTARIAPSVFAGVEARWLHAFQGLTFRRQTGRALYVGPTLHWRVSDGAWLSLAWNIQVAGKEEGDPRQLDLTHFSRHAARIKFGMEF